MSYYCTIGLHLSSIINDNECGKLSLPIHTETCVFSLDSMSRNRVEITLFRNSKKMKHDDDETT